MFWATLWEILKSIFLNTLELLAVIAVVAVMYLPSYLILRPFRSVPQKCADRWHSFRDRHPTHALRETSFTEPMLDFCIAVIFFVITVIVFLCSGGSFLRFLSVWFPGSDIPVDGVVTSFNWKQFFSANGYDGIRNSVICETIMCAAITVYSIAYKALLWIIHAIVRISKGAQDDREAFQFLITPILGLSFTCLLSLRLPAVMQIFRTKAQPVFNLWVALYQADYNQFAAIGVWKAIVVLILFGFVSYWLMAKALRSGFLSAFMGFALCGQVPTRYNYGWYIIVFLLLGIVLDLFYSSMSGSEEDEFWDDLELVEKKHGIMNMLAKLVFPTFLMLCAALVFGLLALILSLS